MPRSFLSLVLLLFASALCAQSDKFNDVLNVGDPAPAWAGLPGVDGKKHALADLHASEAVVVFFFCNSCPVANEYEDRIFALVKKYAERKVAFVAINVNPIPEDSLAEMTKRAQERKFPFAYLFDETQKIAKNFGATYTPEFFVLGKARKVIYMGALDDKGPPAQPTANFVDDALQAALRGELPKTTETLARGCRIRSPKKKKAGS